jgi:hypothetical protein
VTQIVLLVTTIVTLVYQLYRDKRDRRWRKEDAEEKKEIVQFQSEMRRNHTRLQSDLNKNTQISEKAFKEANDVNVKILAVNTELLATRSIVKQIAERPIVPAVIPIRVEDAEAILAQRDHPPQTMKRRKEDDTK